MTHPFWGAIDDAGDTARTFLIPGFAEPVTVNFRPAWVEEVELTPARLDEYAQVFEQFLSLGPAIAATVEQETFRFYQRVYAGYFEDPAQSGEPALGLTTAALHRTKLLALLGIVVSERRSVELDFDYAVDSEHGIAVLFADGRFHEAGGIADVRAD